MNRLSNEDRVRVLACLVEGNSIRATVRITGIAKKTVARFAVELGEACEQFADKVFVNLPCKRIQCDEIWSFCYAKEKNVPAQFKGRSKPTAEVVAESVVQTGPLLPDQPVLDRPLQGLFQM